MNNTEKKPLIILLSDDMRLHSGVATMSREIVLNIAHKYRILQVGGAVKHPEEGKLLDVSDSVNEELGITDADVKILPVSGYGNQDLLRHLLALEEPSAILHFTDPRFWDWLYSMEDEIRKICPIVYYTIWDCLPDPVFNKPFYESCDMLLPISKQTYGIVKRILNESDEKYEDWQIKHIPHGVSDTFYPIKNDTDEYNDMLKLKEQLNIEHKDFVVLFNNRNIRRKQPGDVILAYKEFCDKLSKEESSKCVLVMHTPPVDTNGTDLYAVKDMVCSEYDIVFTGGGVKSTYELNLLYNIADVTINIASNEGFGLSTCESLSAGTPIVVNITGGLQDQCGFKINDKYLTASDYVDLKTLHDGSNLPVGLEWGKWVKPVWPSNISLQGSIPTPYIFDTRADYRTAANKLYQWYVTPKNIRIECGIAGSNWTRLPETGMTSKLMGERFIEAFDTLLKNWKPKTELTLIKI